MPLDQRSQNRKITGAALIVMSSIIISRLTGFLREVMVPNVMTPNQSDAYLIGFMITGLMYEMLVGGAIAAALIPVFSGYIAKNKEKDGWRAVGTFINISLFISIIICILAMIFTKPIVQLIAMGYRGNAVIDETVMVTRILFPSVIFIMLAGLTNGVLNSYHKFAAAAYGPCIYNIGCALSILLFSHIGLSAVAFGVMGSSIVYFLFQFAFAYKSFKLYRFKIYIRHPGFRKLFKLAVPSLISSGISQFNTIISASFATFFFLGSVTALNLADRIWQMPFGVFAQSIGVAILPTISAKYATGETKDYKYILLNSFKMIMLLSVPSMVAFFLLNKEIIILFKFSANFDASFIYKASRILMFFSFAIVTQSVASIMFRAFYAVNDTKTPLFIGIASLVMTFTLNIILYNIFKDISGMAIAYTLSSLMTAVALLLILHKKLNGINLREMLRYTLKTLGASLLMGVVILAMQKSMVPSGSKIVQILSIVAELITGGIIFIMAAYTIRINEVSKIFRYFLYRTGLLLNRIKNVK